MLPLQHITIFPASPARGFFSANLPAFSNAHPHTSFSAAQNQHHHEQPS
jgi:hypothetical protein